MNVFRLIGDMSHLLAFIILPVRMWKAKSCAGVSLKSQILFAFTYTTRYVDVLIYYISLYNTCMKLIFLTASYLTIPLMCYLKSRHGGAGDGTNDAFRAELLLLTSAILALAVNHEFVVVEILWAFSVYLECVGIVPQMYVTLYSLWREGDGEGEGKGEVGSEAKVESEGKIGSEGKVEGEDKGGGKVEGKGGDNEQAVVAPYVYCLTTYTACYIINWVHRYREENFYDPIRSTSGLVQLLILLSYCLVLTPAVRQRWRQWAARCMEGRSRSREQQPLVADGGRRRRLPSLTPLLPSHATASTSQPEPSSGAVHSHSPARVHQ